MVEDRTLVARPWTGQRVKCVGEGILANVAAPKSAARPLAQWPRGRISNLRAAGPGDLDCPPGSFGAYVEHHHLDHDHDDAHVQYDHFGAHLDYDHRAGANDHDNASANDHDDLASTISVALADPR